MFAFGMLTMTAAEAADVADWRQALHYRDGLMIALLAARPLRRRNFAAIEIGRQLRCSGAGYRLQFEASETKTHRPLDFPVPAPLIACLQRYISIHRPVLCGRSQTGDPTERLWVSTVGTSMDETSIYDRIVKLTRAEFGQPINPHLFRDCAATSIATETPEHVRITKEILGHGTLQASERYYNHAQSLQATGRYRIEFSSYAGRPGPITITSRQEFPEWAATCESASTPVTVQMTTARRQSRRPK